MNEETIRAGDSEGFEGNAQSFRIVTKLSLRSLVVPGLDLTRAVLAASIKYPWMHEAARRKSHSKFGAYKTEEADFTFARKFHPSEILTLEAAVMDYADDIAYSVHDLEDFHRIQAVPWHRLDIERKTAIEERARELIASAKKAWKNAPDDAGRRLLDAASFVLQMAKDFGMARPYEGTRRQRVNLRNWTSELIRRYVRDLRPKLVVSEDGDVVLVKRHPELPPLRHEELPPPLGYDRGWRFAPPVTGRREAEPTGAPSPAGGTLISPLLRLARSR